MLKPNRALKIAIAKGALFDGALKFLETKGISISGTEDSNKRKLILKTNINHELTDINEIEILKVRGHDVPVYVEHGAADLGVVGYDVIVDSKADLMQLKDLEFGACTLSVCGPKDKYNSISELPNYVRIATTFPNITKDFFHKKGLEVEVIPLYGSVELGPLTDLSDIIVDLVATGKTLKENGLEVIEEMLPCTARLIANKVSYKLYKDSISKLAQ